MEEAIRYYVVLEFHTEEGGLHRLIGYMDAPHGGPVYYAVRDQLVPALAKQETLKGLPVINIRPMRIKSVAGNIPPAGIIDIAKAIESLKKNQVKEDRILAGLERQMTSGPTAIESHLA